MPNEWNAFWAKSGERKNPLSRLQSIYRHRLIAPAVNYYINRYFNTAGLFLEAGSGTSETTLVTDKQDRRFLALDYSEVVLRQTRLNPVIDTCLQADLLALPLKADSLDGIWNVGVMEHFSTRQIEGILAGFHRALKPGHPVILLWPLKWAPYQIFILAVECLARTIFKKDFQFYPDEISRLRSMRQGVQILRRNNYKNVRAFYNFRDAFSFCVLTGSK